MLHGLLFKLLTKFEIPGKALTTAELEKLSKAATATWSKLAKAQASHEVKAPLRRSPTPPETSLTVQNLDSTAAMCNGARRLHRPQRCMCVLCWKR